MGLVPGVYGGQVSLLVTSLQSLLRPAVASTHQEGAAVGQVGSGGAVTQAAVSKSGMGYLLFDIGKSINFPSKSLYLFLMSRALVFL